MAERRLFGDEVVENIGGAWQRRGVHAQHKAVGRFGRRVHKAGGAAAVLAGQDDAWRFAVWLAKDQFGQRSRKAQLFFK